MDYTIEIAMRNFGLKRTRPCAYGYACDGQATGLLLASWMFSEMLSGNARPLACTIFA